MKTNVVTVTLNPAIDKTVNIDKFNLGGLNRVISSRIDAGGKGINVAKVLNKFGVNVQAAGLIAGVQGQLVLEYLDKTGIKYSFHKLKGETRTNLKIVEEKSNITTEINEPGFIVSEEDISLFKNKLSELLNDASFLVLSGSLPPGVNDIIYYELTELAKSKGVKTVLDADGKALLNGIKASPYAIKPNIFELEMLTNHKMKSFEDIIKAARNFIEQGIEVIVVSMGAKGAIVVNKTESYWTKTYPIVPKSTVGAGDSMVATLVYSFLNQFSLEKTAKWINAAGTVTASKPGSEVCTFEEVLESVKKIEIQKM